MATNAARSPSGKAARGHIAASRRELEAAARLAAVFSALHDIGETPFGRWAVIPEKGYGDNYRPFNTVLGTIYGVDAERQDRYGRAGYQSRAMLYKKDCDMVMSLVVESTLQFALVGLDAELAALRKFYVRLTGERGTADRLHSECAELGAAFERERRKAEAVMAGEPPPPDDAPVRRTAAISYLSPGEIDEIFNEKVAPMVAYTGDDVLSVLVGHPEGRQIVAAYAASAGQGTAAASRRVLDAMWAVNRFAQSAVNERHALRYPFFVIGGVARLGLDAVPDFTEFALNYCAVAQRDNKEKVLVFAAGVVAIFALVLAGPGAAKAVAAVVLAGADLAFAGLNVSLTYVREREQDLANRASRFKGRGKQWATPVVYQDTVMAGAAALLAGIALAGNLTELRKILNAQKKAAPAASAVRRAIPEPHADRATVGKRGVPAADDPERWREFLPEAKRRVAASRDPSVPEDVRSTYPGPDAQANANRSRGAARPDSGAAAGASREPVTGKPARQAPASSRATAPAQKAVPGLTSPRSVADRLKGRGTWTKVKNVNVNTGGWKIKNVPKPLEQLTGEQLEQAWNRDVAEEFAQQISDKPVRVTRPGDRGYGSASTLGSNEMKLQKEFRGRLGAGGTFVRRPDGSMEVVEKIGGAKAAVDVVHYFEPTMRSKFEAEIGFAGAKQRQVSGTTWLSNKFPKSRYTDNTRLSYTIFCPSPPSPATLEFLNAAVEQAPNLEINWIVLQGPPALP